MQNSGANTNNPYLENRRQNPSASILPPSLHGNNHGVVDSRDDALSNLERCSSSQNDEDIYRRIEALLPSHGMGSDDDRSKPWTLSQVLRFTSWILSGVSVVAPVGRHRRHVLPTQSVLPSHQRQRDAFRRDDDDGDSIGSVDPLSRISNSPSTASLFALASVVPLWDDLYIYAALSISNENGPSKEHASATSLLTVLYDILQRDEASLTDCRREHSLTAAAAAAPSLSPRTCTILLSIAPLWNALDRLQCYCQLYSFSTMPKLCHDENANVVWWMPQPINAVDNLGTTVIQSIVRAALSGLILRQEEWQVIVANSRGGGGGGAAATNDAASGAVVGGLCEFKTACVSILNHLLKQSQSSWIYTDHFVVTAGNTPKEEWARKLLQEARRLNDVNMPSSTFAVFSLHCLELLVELVHHGTSSILDENIADDFKRLLTSTDLISYVIAATFGAHGDHDSDQPVSQESRLLPRWTRHAQSSSNNSAVFLQSLAAVQALYRAGAVSMADTLCRHASTQSFVETTWSALLSARSNAGQGEMSMLRDEQSVSNGQLDCLLFALDACRSMTRRALSDALARQPMGTRQEACGQLMLTLLEWSRRHSSIQASALLQRLLVDRLHPLRHDEVSRHFWPSTGKEGVDTTMVQKPDCAHFVEHVMDLIGELASSQSTSLTDHRRLILLSLLDTAYVMFVGDARYVQHALSVQSVEALIQIMVPKRVSVDTASTAVADGDHGLGPTDDGITPTANNLSRLDSSMFVFEEETPPARGWDSSIRIAAATALAVLGNCFINEHGNDVVVLRSRIMNAIHTFVEDGQLLALGSSSLSASISRDGHSSAEAAANSSLDLTRRRLRLLAELHASDNEEDMASLVYGTDVVLQRSLSNLHLSLKHSQEAIEVLRAKEKQLEAEKQANASRMTAQAMTHDRQTSSWKRLMERQAKDLVDVHATERQKAETLASQLTRQVADAEASARECHDNLARAQASLDSVTSQLSAAATREQALADRVERSESEAKQIAEELRIAKQQGNTVQVREKELREQAMQQSDYIEQLEQSESELRESLENLFGDMVNLAQLYVFKEKEEATNRVAFETRLDKLRQRLEAERQRNAELEEQDKRSQYEIEVLKKNYAKAREKLDKEREERRKEADQRRKRAGPISYINQLHTSAASAATAGDRDVSRKENRPSASSSLASSRSKPSSSK